MTPAQVRVLESRVEELSLELATRLHDNWRAPRLLRDGSYEPRPKPTIDPDWIAATGTDTVDIANVEHRDLPKDWQ
ncbi:hypothetical protein ACLMAL_02330 [Nocardia sp. CWNU-33]|uniref:hypothetical protein n=1 Tax=Nocardia sp. CWNU-33 TaxID=3392117 RepID=UPI00398E37D2